jgi:hypothetical protein
MMTNKKLELFMAKVTVTDGCWFWNGAKNNNGYGVFSTGKMAHRVSFEHFRYDVPLGMEIDHLCRIRHCVNPEHLRAVTHGENIRVSLVTQKTHCKNGHSLDDCYRWKTKTKTGRGFSRRCRTCHDACVKKWRAENKEIYSKIAAAASLRHREKIKKIN